MGGEAEDGPREGLSRGVAPRDEEVQHEVAQVVLAHVLTPLPRVRQEEAHEAPRCVEPLALAAAGGAAVRPCAAGGAGVPELVHHGPAVLVQQAEVLPRVSLGGQAQPAQRPPQGVYEAVDADLLRPVEGLEEGRLGIPERADGLSESDLADGVQREAVHQVEDVHRRAWLGGLQDVAEHTGVPLDHDPDVVPEELRREHVARGLALVVPLLAVGVEDPPSQEVEEALREPPALGVVVEVRLQDVRHVPGVRGHHDPVGDPQGRDNGDCPAKLPVQPEEEDVQLVPGGGPQQLGREAPQPVPDDRQAPRATGPESPPQVVQEGCGEARDKGEADPARARGEGAHHAPCEQKGGSQGVDQAR
mmetsp:Transcript_33954/g.105485  ORF Transcript_33954/g.105485 Transcript_33954/m.105485 type:complete len:361 (+) Transcript_33954:926-2008(+)